MAYDDGVWSKIRRCVYRYIIFKPPVFQCVLIPMEHIYEVWLNGPLKLLPMLC